MAEKAGVAKRTAATAENLTKKALNVAVALVKEKERADLEASEKAKVDSEASEKAKEDETKILINTIKLF